MQTFSALALGTIVYVPRVTTTEIEMPCPDCNGTHVWHISSPSGMKREIECPRCKGGQYKWLIPKRHEYTLLIEEESVLGTDINQRVPHGKEEAVFTVRYKTNHYNSRDEAELFLTREEAEAAGVKLLAEVETKWGKDYVEKLKRDEAQANLKIVEVLKEQADRKYEELKGKIDELKSGMYRAIEYPELYGPVVKHSSISAQAMTTWLTELLSAADIEGWSEEELAEHGCQ